MTSDIVFFSRLALIVVVVVGGMIGLANMAAKASCEQQWADSGFAAQYGFFSGCRIAKDGKWIPTDVYRELED